MLSGGSDTARLSPLVAPAARGSLGEKTVAPRCSSSASLSPPSSSRLSVRPPGLSLRPGAQCKRYVPRPDVCPRPWELCSGIAAGGLGGA